MVALNDIYKYCNLFKSISNYDEITMSLKLSVTCNQMINEHFVVNVVDDVK